MVDTCMKTNVKRNASQRHIHRLGARRVLAIFPIRIRCDESNSIRSVEKRDSSGKGTFVVESAPNKPLMANGEFYMHL